jgi:hypothetical protein
LPSGFCEGIVIVLPLIVALIGPTVKKLSEKALPIITAVISDETPAAMLAEYANGEVPPVIRSLALQLFTNLSLDFVSQLVPSYPVTQVQVPPLQVPPFWQTTPLQASLLQEVYTTAQNALKVKNALKAMCLIDFIINLFYWVSKYFAKDTF